MKQIQEFLDATFNSNSDVKGIALIDRRTGLSLGVRGVARNSDSAFISQFASTAPPLPAMADYLSWSVYVAAHDDALLAVYKDKQHQPNSQSQDEESS